MRKPPVVTLDTPIDYNDVDLEKEDVRLKDGTRLTQQVVDEFIEAAHAGRPSMTGAGKHSPSVTLRFAAPDLHLIDSEAEETGQTRSQVIRQLIQPGIDELRERKVA